tara:strand:+ start:604 stop:2019 length:1416 start_codon:yes stop_codon:yes gene_type:complete
MEEINRLYETNFDNYILKQYPSKLTNDEYNVEIHTYSIWKRLDLTHLDVYTIDPVGCEDADDGFSIYKKNDKYFIAIHIADPTEYINIKSDLWEKIIQQSISHYPSNRKPIHLLPKNILQLSSLVENECGNIKNAISIITEVDKNFKPIKQIEYFFSKIMVKKENNLTYKDASLLYKINMDLYNVFLFSEQLKKIREIKTKAVVLNEISNSQPIYDDNNNYIFYKDSKDEILMKQMIAELAIFVNSFIGEYLKYNFSGKGIFRTCNASGLIQTLDNDISGIDLMNKIILNGISADYLSNVLSHDLIGMPEYSHFTSPMRRACDCICHYLLKYNYLKQFDKNIPLPFDNTFLDNASYISNYTLKNSKKRQYNDTKFRLIQCMDNMLHTTHTSIDLEYIILSNTGLFINIIIQKIENHSVQLSYTLRIKNLCKDEEHLNKKKYITITKVNCKEQYDQECIPELDSEIIKYFNS